MAIQIHLDAMLVKRKISLTELSKSIGLSLTNLSLLKNGNVRGVRFDTLEKICIVLDCQPGDLLEYSRIIPRLSEIVLDDMINSFERDGEKSDDELKEISIVTEQMLDRAKPLLKELKVNKQKMRDNLDLTNGLILSQRLTFYLADKIGKDTANELMHDVAKYALENNLTLEEAALQNSIVSKNITESELKNILDPETYIGLAVKQAQLIIEDIENKRTK